MIKLEIQKDKFYDLHNLREVTVIDSLIKIVKKKGTQAIIVGENFMALTSKMLGLIEAHYDYITDVIREYLKI